MWGVRQKRPCSRDGEHGQGIKVNDGDQFVIPPGAITLSLDPAANGTFSRGGLLMFIQWLILSGAPEKPADLEQLFKHYEQMPDQCLESSSILIGLNIHDEKDHKEIWERILKLPNTEEYWAAQMDAYDLDVMKALENNDARRAAWSTYHAVASHTIFQIKGKHFEEILWHGYDQYRFLTRVKQAAAQTPAEISALQRLEPLFDRLDGRGLHTLVDSNLPIAPRLGVSGLREEVLLAKRSGT